MPRKEPYERRICLSHCPVKECDTDIYRGSRCKELREKAGVHYDPDIFKGKKPKPILFNGEMVRAIREGRKTVTRRGAFHFAGKRAEGLYRDSDGRLVAAFADTDAVIRSFRAPFDKGDILYVRETTCACDFNRWLYKADYSDEDLKNSPEVSSLIHWTPSIHMPKEAARIFLRVTDVRLEHLNDMKDEDFTKEGITCDSTSGENTMSLQEKFIELWDSTIPEHKALSKWDGNPWVWVIEFEEVRF